MNTKKNILIAMILAICLASTFISIAFITSQTTADNIITFGSIKMKLHETYINEQGKEEVFDASVTTDVTYDANQSRIFCVENIGKHPIYVRLSFKLTGEDKDGKPIEIEPYINFETDESDWIYEDGWYYYQNVLDPDVKTKELITDVIFDINEITKDYPGSNYKLEVIAQGVQSENNDSDVLQVVGWPED